MFCGEIIMISDDSRNIFPGDIFVAIDGGHNFVADAVMNRGAMLAVVQYEIPNIPYEKQRIVPDTRRAFLEYGRAVRNKFNGKVIAITGSAGKTTTKEMLYTALAGQCRVYATYGNFNNDIGVARTLCGIDMDADVVIIEIGMNHPGEINNLVQYVRPDIAVITNIFPMHIGNFSDGILGIARAKAEIFSNRPSIAVINRNSMCFDILKNVAEKSSEKIITFNGENKECVLAIVAVCDYDVSVATDMIRDFGFLPGRGKIHKLKISDGEYVLVDESYSGQPESMKIALGKLSVLPGRKIAVLGEMTELGQYSHTLHCEVGKFVSTQNIDIVVGVGKPTKDILSQLSKYQTSFYFDDNTFLVDFLLNDLIQSGDSVMIKGSHYGSMLFETVEALIKKGSDL